MPRKSCESLATSVKISRLRRAILPSDIFIVCKYYHVSKGCGEFVSEAKIVATRYFFTIILFLHNFSCQLILYRVFCLPTTRISFLSDLKDTFYFVRSCTISANLPFRLGLLDHVMAVLVINSTANFNAETSNSL